MQQLTLLEFNRKIKDTLLDHLSGYHWVVAEIASLQVHGSGHCYLDLVQKEGDQIVARNRATIWANVYNGISSEFLEATGESLKAGMHLLCCLSVSYHEIYSLGLNIVRIDPSFTMGQRALQRKQVVERLEKEGLIGRNADLDLSLVPQQIAVISSPSAAGLEDFISQLTSNDFGYSFKTRLFPAIMQGNDAVQSIINALNLIEEEADSFDCIVMIRGGGAQLDLDCYDSYDLAVQIALSPLPILTGIGHQRDDTVADIVSWKKLKTPTAVAGFILDRMRSFEEHIINIYNEIYDFTAKRIQNEKSSLSKIQLVISKLTVNLVQIRKQSLSVLQERRKSTVNNLLLKRNHQLQMLIQETKRHDPIEILKKGYSISLINGKIPNPKEPPVKRTRMQTKTLHWVIESEIKSTNRNDGK